MDILALSPVGQVGREAGPSCRGRKSGGVAWSEEAGVLTLTSKLQEAPQRASVSSFLCLDSTSPIGLSPEEQPVGD